MGATPAVFEDLTPWRGGEPPGDEFEVRLDCCVLSKRLKVGFWLELGDELLLARASWAPPAVSLPSRAGIWTAGSVGIFCACMPKGSNARGDEPRAAADELTLASWLEVGLLLLYKPELSPYKARC